MSTNLWISRESMVPGETYYLVAFVHPDHREERIFPRRELAYTHLEHLQNSYDMHYIGVNKIFRVMVEEPEADGQTIQTVEQV